MARHTGRTTQPYRKGARARTAALAAMLRGEAALKPHPLAAKRKLQRSARRRRGRPKA